MSEETRAKSWDYCPHDVEWALPCDECAKNPTTRNHYIVSSVSLKNDYNPDTVRRPDQE